MMDSKKRTQEAHPGHDLVDDPNDDDAFNSMYAHFHVVKNKTIERDDGYHKYRDLWREAALEHTVTPFPLHLDIEVTSYCNLLCPMCPRTHRVELGQWENRMMRFETFKGIIDEGAPLGLRAINLNNFGESLFNKDLVRMIRYAKDSGIIDIMMHSNGTALTEDLSRQLIESGLDTIIFSIDSITREIYENIRIGAEFEPTIAAIRQFAEIRRQSGKKTPHIRVSMVRMKENAHEADKFKAFWGDDADSITYVDYRNQDGLDTEDRYVDRKSENRGYACPSLWQRMTINATGEVTACCRDAGKRLTIGRLDENTRLVDIWDGAKLKEARRLHECGEASKLGACKGCDHIRGWQPASRKSESNGQEEDW